jgi:hypothetical protein
MFHYPEQPCNIDDPPLFNGLSYRESVQNIERLQGVIRQQHDKIKKNEFAITLELSYQTICNVRDRITASRKQMKTDGYIEECWEEPNRVKYPLPYMSYPLGIQLSMKGLEAREREYGKHLTYLLEEEEYLQSILFLQSIPNEFVEQNLENETPTDLHVCDYSPSPNATVEMERISKICGCGSFGQPPEIGDDSSVFYLSLFCDKNSRMDGYL